MTYILLFLAAALAVFLLAAICGLIAKNVRSAHFSRTYSLAYEMLIVNWVFSTTVMFAFFLAEWKLGPNRTVFLGGAVVCLLMFKKIRRVLTNLICLPKLLFLCLRENKWSGAFVRRVNSFRLMRCSDNQDAIDLVSKHPERWALFSPELNRKSHDKYYRQERRSHSTSIDSGRMSGTTGAALSGVAVSTSSVAAALFALTTDRDGQDSLVETAHLGSVEGLDRSKTRTEIILLNLSAIYIALFRFAKVRATQAHKLEEMYLHYLATLKVNLQPLGAKSEEEFLQMSEARLAAYNKAYDSWLSGHERGSGHEQSFVIAETFFHFCGVSNLDPITLTIVQHHFFTTMKEVGEQLSKCKMS